MEKLRMQIRPMKKQRVLFSKLAPMQMKRIEAKKLTGKVSRELKRCLEHNNSA